MRKAEVHMFGKVAGYLTETHARLQRNLTKALNEVPMPFISTEQQEEYKGLLEDRMARIWG